MYVFRKDIEYHATDGDKLFAERIVEYFRTLLDQSLRARTTANTNTTLTQPSEDLHTLEIVCFLKTNYTYHQPYDSSVYPPLSSSSNVGGDGDGVSVRGCGFFDHASSWIFRQRKQEKIASILSYRRHLDYLTAKHIQLKTAAHQGGVGSADRVEMSFMDRLQAANEGQHKHDTITLTTILSQTVPLPAYDTPLVHETRIEETDTEIYPAVDCSMREEDDVVLSYASLDDDDDDQEPPFHNLEEQEDEIIPSNHTSSPLPISSSRTSQAVLNSDNQASSTYINHTRKSHINTSLLPYTPSATHTHTHTPAGHTETGQSNDGTDRDDVYTDEVAVFSQSAYQVSCIM